jgi:hypothetical protein
MMASGFELDASLYKDDWKESWVLQDEGTIDIDNDVPEEIANAVIDTLESDEPQARYMVVGTRDAATNTLQNAMRRVVQLSTGHTHSLSRDELVAMLDALLAE